MNSNPDSMTPQEQTSDRVDLPTDSAKGAGVSDYASPSVEPAPAASAAAPVTASSSSSSPTVLCVAHSVGSCLVVTALIAGIATLIAFLVISSRDSNYDYPPPYVPTASPAAVECDASCVSSFVTGTCDSVTGCPKHLAPTRTGSCKPLCPRYSSCAAGVSSQSSSSQLTSSLNVEDLLRARALATTSCAQTTRMKCVTSWGDPHITHGLDRFDPMWHGWILLSRCDGLQLFAYAEQYSPHGRPTVQTRVMVRYSGTVLLFILNKDRPGSTSLMVGGQGVEGLTQSELPEVGGRTVFNPETAREVTISRVSRFAIHVCTADGSTIVVRRMSNACFNLDVCLAQTCNLNNDGLLGIVGAPSAVRYPLPTESHLVDRTPVPRNGGERQSQYIEAWRQETQRLLGTGATTDASFVGTECSASSQNELRDSAESLATALEDDMAADRLLGAEPDAPFESCTELVQRCRTECPSELLTSNPDPEELCVFATEFLAARAVNANLSLDDPRRVPENVTSHAAVLAIETADPCPGANRFYCDACAPTTALANSSNTLRLSNFSVQTGGCYTCSITSCPRGEELLQRPAKGDCICAPTKPECEFDSDCPEAAPTPATVCRYSACVAAKCTFQARPLGFPCRAAADACDAPEHCGGSSYQCPADSFRSEGTACTTAAGASSTCRGTDPKCFPPPALVQAEGEYGVCTEPTLNVLPLHSCSASCDAALCQCIGSPDSDCRDPLLVDQPNTTLTSLTSCGEASTCFRLYSACLAAAVTVSFQDSACRGWGQRARLELMALEAGAFTSANSSSTVSTPNLRAACSWHICDVARTTEVNSSSSSFQLSSCSFAADTVCDFSGMFATSAPSLTLPTTSTSSPSRAHSSCVLPGALLCVFLSIISLLV